MGVAAICLLSGISSASYKLGCGLGQSTRPPCPTVLMSPHPAVPVSHCPCIPTPLHASLCSSLSAFFCPSLHPTPASISPSLPACPRIHLTLCPFIPASIPLSLHPSVLESLHPSAPRHSFPPSLCPSHSFIPVSSSLHPFLHPSPCPQIPTSPCPSIPFHPSLHPSVPPFTPIPLIPPSIPISTAVPSRRKMAATDEGSSGTMCRRQQRRRHASPARRCRWKRPPHRDAYSHALSGASGLCCGDGWHKGGGVGREGCTEQGAGGQTPVPATPSLSPTPILAIPPLLPPSSHPILFNPILSPPSLPPHLRHSTLVTLPSHPCHPQPHHSIFATPSLPPSHPPPHPLPSSYLPLCSCHPILVPPILSPLPPHQPHMCHPIPTTTSVSCSWALLSLRRVRSHRRRRCV